MNPNDARIVRVYTQETGGATAHADNTAPNATQPARAATFDVVIEVDAGGVVAGGAGGYSLYLVTVDETTGATLPAPFTLRVPAPPATNNFSQAAPWVAVGGGGNPDYELLAVITLPVANIPVPPPLPHILKCYASLVSAGNQFVNTVESEPFVIV